MGETLQTTKEPKRIIQFPHVDGTFRSLGDNVYVDHCKKMVLFNREKGLRSYVKRTLITFPICFMIIDRQYLVISIDEIRHVENTSARHFKGEIIICDPQQELISVFLSEWEKIENSPYTKTISIEEF